MGKRVERAEAEGPEAGRQMAEETEAERTRRLIDETFAGAIREAFTEEGNSAPSPATETGQAKAKKGGRRNTTRGGGKP